MYDDRVESEDVMQQGIPDKRLTYDDFVLFPDDGLRHEIIDGEHYVTPCPNMRHQLLIGRLHFEIELFLRAHRGVGRIFIAAAQDEILTAKNVQGAPALVVEVLSPGTRRTDEQAKRQLFDRGGVREYWMVDPDFNVVTVFRRQADGSFPLVANLAHAEALTTPLLPGLEIGLTGLFAD